MHGQSSTRVAKAQLCVGDYLLRPFLEIRFCCKNGATNFVSAEEEALIVEKLLFANLRALLKESI
jgi:hypothetical protein